MIDAVAIAKGKRPDLDIEGPLQYDAAINPETAKTKMKGRESAVAGKVSKRFGLTFDCADRGSICSSWVWMQVCAEGL